MLKRIDHVGIAVRDLDVAIARYRTAFGLDVVAIEENAEQGVREAMLALEPGGSPPDVAAVGGPSYVQLLEPLAPDTPVGRFLDRRGEGLHHVGYAVDGIADALQALAGHGIQLIDQRPRHGALGAAIAFVHPSDLSGVLTELVEPAGS